jgi:hypothetical protein
MYLLKSLKDKWIAIREIREWLSRRYESPSPSIIKRQVLKRIGVSDATWVETGTFLGDTANFLAKNSKIVYTIEPDASLFEMAMIRFKKNNSVIPIHGLSEDIFPELLPKLKGKINFWLDGHYSGGLTHKGPKDCPLKEELLAIENNISNYDYVIILIDDVRCFNPSIKEFADYPHLNYLVDWAKKNDLNWYIEHDIFIASTK